MRPVLSLPSLVVVAWVSGLGFLGLLAIMAATPAWNPHFLPATATLALVNLTGSALVVGASWRIVRGPDRRRALACLLVGAAPFWFLAGFFLYGLTVVAGQRLPINVATRLLAPLALSVMDLDARIVYPQRTAGEKVVMISAPMPEAEARAQVAAMDRHVEALEARLDRKIPGRIHWVRGPMFGIGHRAIIGMCMGTRPGDEWPDAEGLCTTDRHEVAHCVLTGQCTAGFAPPAVLTEGWAEANQGSDRLHQALQVRGLFEDGRALTLRRLTGPDRYDRHEWLAYRQGAPLVNFFLDRFGPDRFVRLYTECSPSTFESDCRRILGLDLDGLDAAYRADIERRVTQAGPIERRWLEGLRLGPAVKVDDWKAFLDEYFAAAERLLAPYHHSRLTAVWARSSTDPRGESHDDTNEVRVLRSGEFASLRRRYPDHELAFLAHPRRSIRADRYPPEPWQDEDASIRTPDQARHRTLRRINEFDDAGRRSVALVALTDDIAGFARLSSVDRFVVTALERFTEGGRPRVRLRIEDHAPANWRRDWRAVTYVLAADDLYAVQSVALAEGAVPDNTTYQSSFTYDRHEGIPVLRSQRNSELSPDGPPKISELKVVERRFGPIPEDEFDPDRFLDGARVAEPRSAPDPEEPSPLRRWFWLPFPIGGLSLLGGVGLLLGTRPGSDPSPVRPTDPGLL